MSARFDRRESLFHPLDNLELARSSDSRTGLARDLPRGVTRNGERYVARVSLAGIGQRYVGSYGTVEEAVEAIDALVWAHREGMKLAEEARERGESLCDE